MPKVLFVMTEESLIHWGAHIEALKDEDFFEVETLTWWDEEIQDHNIPKVVGAAMYAAVVVLDLEDLSQKEAISLLTQIRDCGAKIVVVSCQPGSIETASEAIQLPAEFADAIIPLTMSPTNFINRISGLVNLVQAKSR